MGYRLTHLADGGPMEIKEVNPGGTSIWIKPAPQYPDTQKSSPA
jgi:hypothetical protein